MKGMKRITTLFLAGSMANISDVIFFMSFMALPPDLICFHYLKL